MAIRTRIGVMVPSTNTTCEADFQLTAPADVTIHGHRMWMTNDGEGDDAMAAMNSEIESSAKYLSTANVDVIAYGCTTGSFYKGPGWDDEMVRLIEDASGKPAVATSPSVIDALRYFGAKKLSIASPYPKWNNEKLRVYMEQSGFEVLNIEAEPVASEAGNQGINDQDPAVIVDFASKICHPDADVLFCSCTAWRSVEAVQELERITGKPVVTSNQATIWSVYRQISKPMQIQGFGRLLNEPPSAITSMES